jgi:hypothetical protein
VAGGPRSRLAAAMTKHHLIPLAGVLGALAFAPTAFAGQPPRSDLNPPPPDFYSCKATGAQTICRASLSFHEDPVADNDLCPGFAVVDQGDVRQEFTRRYDANGDFVERVKHETWTNSFWSNPLTGNTIPYTQRGTQTDRATVPGDLDSVRSTLVGENIYTDPVTHEKVLRSAGRTVFGPDGTLESSSGQQPFIELFVFGDPSAFDAVCAALAR